VGTGENTGEDRDASRLRASPAAVFAELLRETGAPLDARALKRMLLDRGLDRTLVDAAWKRAQPSLRRHRYVRIDPPGRYRWRAGTQEPGPAPEQALERLVAERLTATDRAELAEPIRAALAERDALEQRARSAYREAIQLRAANERQVRVDAARALAEVAMEVEELAATGVDARIAVERVRALVAGFGLVPIGRAGETVAFDPARHDPIGAIIPAGSAGLVVRPGYTWRIDDQDVLLARAQIALV
jgi:hypothetical protein